MSRATAAVRFPDGTVKWCLYNGTSDNLIPRLFDSPIEPWDAYYAKRDGPEQVNLWPEPEGEVVPVTIYSDYGGGWTWPGTAAPNVVVGPLDPWDDDTWNKRVDGRPDWYTTAYNGGRTQ